MLRLSTSVLDLPIPVPPVAEQRRIVSKVDQLMTICSDLCETLASEENSRTRLLESLLRDALNGKVEAAA